MPATTYLVFGDLHGRALPAFRLAMAWAREHGVTLAGLLQVGDLGDSRLENDGLQQPGEDADAVFHEHGCPEALWFTAGNHEDFDRLRHCQRRAGRDADTFSVDAYGKLRCIADGRIAELPGGPRVAALWGIDGRAPRARERIPAGGRLSRRSAAALAGAAFDVLLTHESPRDAVLRDNGSEEVGALIRDARPAFAFFGHYHSTGRRVEGEYGATRVYHLSHLELDSRAEEGSAGVLRWQGGAGEFEYLDPAWLRTVTRSNWRHR